MERLQPGETYQTLSQAEARDIALNALYETVVNWLDLTSQARSYFRRKPEELHAELDRLAASGKVTPKLIERIKAEFPVGTS